MTIQKQKNSIKFGSLVIPITVLKDLTKDNKYKVIEGYSIEYVGNIVYLTNQYTRIKLSKNLMEEITSEYCRA